MSNNQPEVNFKPDDWEQPIEGTTHPGQALALVEGATITSKKGDNTTRTVTFKKGTLVTFTINQGGCLASWNPDFVLTDTSTR